MEEQVFNTPPGMIISSTGQIGPVQCNTVDFYNQGNTAVYVNDRLILPFQGWTIEGRVGELNNSTYWIRFVDIPGQMNALCVTYKIYQLTHKPQQQ